MLFCMVLFGRTLGAGAFHANSQYYPCKQAADSILSDSDSELSVIPVLASSCQYCDSDSEFSVIPVLVSICQHCV